MPPIIDIAEAVLIVFMIFVHLLGYGMLLTRAAKFTHDDPWVMSATICGSGASAFGFEMWALGYLNGWHPLIFIASSIATSLIVIQFVKPQWHDIRSSVNLAVQSSRRLLFNRENSILTRFLLVVAVTTICVAAVSCLRSTMQQDEAEYHWPAPLLWTASHHWVETPYRFMNGPSFIELLYLPGALFDNMTAGHLTHFLLWLVLLTSCCALGRLLKAPPLPVMVSLAACPIITNQSSVMMNDLGATTFVIAALVVLFTLSNSANPYRHTLLSSFVLCGALSAKQPFALGVLPVMVAYLFFGLRAENVKVRLSRVVAFVLPCFLTELLWLVHTIFFTGKFFDIPINSVWLNPAEVAGTPRAHKAPTGLAGPPSFKKTMILLITPFVTWLLGNQEPYGGRTGLVIPVFLPVFIIMVKRLTPPLQRLGWWIMGTATFYFLTVGIFVVRTRYHMVVWALWSALAGTGFALLNEQLTGKKKVLLFLGFCFAVMFGCADSWRNLLQWEPNTPHYMPKINWLWRE